MSIVTSLSIVSVGRCKYVPQSHMAKHCHTYYHLLFFMGGHGSIEINDMDFRVKENDLFLIPPGNFHEITSESRQPLRSLEVKFHAFDKELHLQLQAIPIQFSCDHLKVKISLQNIVDEAISQTQFYKDIIASNMIELLLHLVRMNQLNVPPLNDDSFILVTRDSESDITGKILEFIHLHYTEQLTLHYLAQTFNINQAYLCQVFSEKFSVSPIQYINRLKLQKVKDLLLNTDLSVTEISENVGFNSIHYMSRYFTLKENISPLEFRRRSQNHFHISVQEYKPAFPSTFLNSSNPLD